MARDLFDWMDKASTLLDALDDPLDESGRRRGKHYANERARIVRFLRKAAAEHPHDEGRKALSAAADAIEEQHHNAKGNR